MSNMGKNIAMFIALVIVMFLILTLNPLFIIVAILIGLIYRGVLSSKIIKPLIVLGLVLAVFSFVRGLDLSKVKVPKPVSSSPKIELNETQTYTYNDTLTQDKIITDYVVKVTDDKDTLTSADVEVANYDDLVNDFNNPEYTGTETLEFTVTDTDGNTTTQKAKLKIAAVDTSSTDTSSTDSASSDTGSNTGIISGAKNKIADKAIATTLQREIDNKGYGTSTLDSTNGTIDVSLSKVNSATAAQALSGNSTYSQKVESIASEVCGKTSTYKTLQVRGNDGGVIYTKNCN